MSEVRFGCQFIVPSAVWGWWSSCLIASSASKVSIETGYEWMISSSIGCCEKTEEARIYLQKAQGSSTSWSAWSALNFRIIQTTLHWHYLTLHWTLDIGHYLTLLNRLWRIMTDSWWWSVASILHLQAASGERPRSWSWHVWVDQGTSHRLAYPIALLKFPFHVWCFLICCFCIRAHLICVCRHEMTADVRPVQNNGPCHHYRAGGRESAESAESARCKREIGGTCFGRRWI